MIIKFDFKGKNFKNMNFASYFLHYSVDSKSKRKRKDRYLILLNI